METPWYRKIFLIVLIVCLAAGTVLPAFAIEPDDSVHCTEEEERQIWNYLIEMTKHNEIAAAGIMGNLYCESHLSSENLETMGKKAPEFKNKTYTSATDDGSYQDFAKDGFGYGIAQWTFPRRKQRLMELAEEQNKSVGDLSVQLDLLAEELQKFNMLQRLSGSQDLEFVSEYFMRHYENPADQGEKVKERRLKKSKDFLNKYSGTKKPTQAQEAVANIAAFSDAYGIAAEKGQAQQWAAAVYKAAGLPEDKSKNAEESAKAYGVSENLARIPVGAAVYGHASSTQGHVGIYIGNNQVYHNLDGVKVDTLSDWIANYRGFCWGWIGGTDLTDINN